MKDDLIELVLPTTLGIALLTFLFIAAVSCGVEKPVPCVETGNCKVIYAQCDAGEICDQMYQPEESTGDTNVGLQ